MGKTFFVTGTDTDAGKTFVSVALLNKAQQEGLSTAAVKPAAAGCHVTPEGLRNDDALALMQAMTLELPYETVNPEAIEPPIAPHIAVQEAGKYLNARHLEKQCRQVMEYNADITLIEGAGGWRVPLNKEETFADIPQLLDIPIILVVGMKLGCINHAALTYEAIRHDHLNIAGWVANQVDPHMLRKEANLETLKYILDAPFLGYVPWRTSDSEPDAATHLILP